MPARSPEHAAAKSWLARAFFSFVVKVRVVRDAGEYLGEPVGDPEGDKAPGDDGGDHFAFAAWKGGAVTGNEAGLLCREMVRPASDCRCRVESLTMKLSWRLNVSGAELCLSTGLCGVKYRPR